METSSAARGVSLSISPPPATQSSRREWRVVSEHSSRSTGSEQGRELADVDFCSINIDGNLENDNLQHELQTVAGQRKELEHMEIELRARIVARSGLMEMQKTFDNRFKEHANAYAKLQEQLHQKEQAVHELEMKIDEKDRELHAVKLDNEAAWAKEDLLREQNKELLSYRRERDNSEAERSQHLKQIHDLQEHIQDRERQFLELQEQHRVAQEAIMYKDEQLREAQAWIARVQEMDALQSTTNHNLQTELRERIEQYNQFWLACQRQFADLERHHLHTVQQLQIELANAKERNGTCADGSSPVIQENSNDSSRIAHTGLEANGSLTSTANSSAFPYGYTENQSSHVSTGNTSIRVDHVHGVAIAPSTLLGMPPSHLLSTQVAALGQFIMHQQGIPNSAPALVSQSHVAQFQSQHWQNQQVTPEASQNFDDEAPVNGLTARSDYLGNNFSQGLESNSVNPSPAEDDKTYPVSSLFQESQQNISSQFRESLRLDALPQKSEAEEKTIPNLSGSQGPISQKSFSPAESLSVTAVPANINEQTGNNGSSVASSGQRSIVNNGKSLEMALFDERSLLACIVRTLPPGSGGKIRISSTLPNRLGKMLAPLHWHDYKKKYGKLDDFLAGHPELFLIDGDYIQLREGAQEIIAATAAVAKVAAAAKTAAASPFSTTLPSVAVTPMSQSHRLKRDPSINANYSHNSLHCHLDNGNNINVNILSKTKDTNGSENRHGHSSGSNSMGKQQDRRAGVSSNYRR